MNSQPLRIQLRWHDPISGDVLEPVLSPPIALGREFSQMPAELDGRRISRMVLSSGEVSRFHALIDVEQGGLVAIDQNSRNGTYLNGQRQARCGLANGDILQIGPYQISVSFAIAAPSAPAAALPSTITFHPDTDLPDPRASAGAAPAIAQAETEFPPAAFLQSQVMPVQSLHATGLPVEEIDYAAIGGGLGSFIWADFLRIWGVKASQIVALGMEKEPYARYRRLCLNSQIPLHERLRSNSDSCPDNIWGWPSYALREAWRDFFSGQINQSLKYLWQVFAEPTFAETYTPRAGNVFNSIDREANRIGWDSIFRYGRVRAIRQTDDGRYAIAYSRSSANRRDRAFLLARYVHLATGYPAIQFLPDLQAYREKTGDFKSVVNAYEDHSHVYQHLEQNGGTILIRGRGIVASRIVQRLYEARQRHRNIQVLHLMRSPKPAGNKYGSAQRKVENHYEFQPFNWPKACWGGELRRILEEASPQERASLLADWGGTTTADRGDWRRIVAAGLRQGWYQIAFGEVERVERDGANSTITYIKEKGLNGEIKLAADFVIDATGLDARAIASPLLEDLVSTYNLPLNHLGRLSVANDFELVEMRNRNSRMYAAGAITLGGPYAPVDSFLGLQYAALRAVDSLAAARATGLRRLNPISSLAQWLKWAANRAP